MLVLDGVSKRLSGFSIENLSIDVMEGDYFILLGVSGAGKSILLETIAGLLKPDKGNILLDGKDITHEKIQKRNIGLVFQDHAVFPHLKVAENILYPLQHRSFSHEEKQKRLNEVAALLDISGLLDRKPKTLSGGELQRVALARALVQKPRLLLLDEPLASLDAGLRSGLRSLLRKLNRNGQTIIHVTHDYQEAVSLGNKVAVIHQGKLIQSGDPEEVFLKPASEFVAHFTGTRNFFKAEIKQDPCKAFLNKLEINIASGSPNTNGHILIRSEEVFLSKEEVKTSAVNNFKGQVLEITPAISGYEVMIDIGIHVQALITQESVKSLNINEGSDIILHFKASAAQFIPE